MKNPNEPNNVRVTFGDGASVVIEKLTERQQRQLSELLQASGVRYNWHARLVARPTFGERVGYRWRRMLMWLQPLLLFAFLATSAPAQEWKPKPKPLVEVAIVTTGERGEDAGAQFHKLFRAALAGRRDVAVHARAEWKIYLAVTEIKSRGRVIGYAGGVMLYRKTDDLYWFAVKAAPTLKLLASDAMASLDEEVFAKLGR